MSTQSRVDPADLWRVAAAAEETGANRSTLVTAVRQGQCPSRRIEGGDGPPMVTLEDVRAWMAEERRPGRKPAKR